MTNTTAASASIDWSARADQAQHDIERYFAAPAPQMLHNRSPFADGDDATFNYWWLAHLVDVRLDAFERTGQGEWLTRARDAAANIVERNGGSLFNDYFDDMLWLGLALDRLHSLAGDAEALDSALKIWQHVVDFGWNDHCGASVAWRKQQLYYKNTPANGPFVMLSLRLARKVDESRRGEFEQFAQTAFDWITTTLVSDVDGFVEDGINREGDGAIDRHWRFTYNQGLYAGAAAELSTVRGPKTLASATRTLMTAIRELSADGVFVDEGDGGDEGLFKGVYYRYAGLVLDMLDADSDEWRSIHHFVVRSTDALWANHARDGHLLAQDDWGRAGDGTPVNLSTQLSAVMATELRAKLEA